MCPSDDGLRPVNSSHDAFKSAPVHALGLCNVIADPAIGAELSGVARTRRTGRDHTAFRAVTDRPADRLSSPPTKRLSAGRQLNAIFALALLAAPSVRGCPMKADMALFLAEARFKPYGGGFFADADDRPSQRA